LVSTVDDLLRFGEWLLAQPFLAAMRTPVAGKPGGGYGLGLALERVGGFEVCGHGGSYGGFQSSFLLVPGRNAVVVGLTNSGVGAQALRLVEDALFERLFGTPRVRLGTVDLGTAELEALAGLYRNPEFELDVFAADGLQLRLRDARGEWPALRARPVGRRAFEIVGGLDDGHRFDFLLGDERPRFVRYGWRLAERVS
jgi:CubicO group peptidase (beta-lactamase class C family)